MVTPFRSTLQHIKMSLVIRLSSILAFAEGTGIDLDEVADEENPLLSAEARRPPAALLAMEDERMGAGGAGNMGGEAGAYKVI